MRCAGIHYEVRGLAYTGRTPVYANPVGFLPQLSVARSLILAHNIGQTSTVSA
jgi:hypothetical protein